MSPCVIPAIYIYYLTRWSNHFVHRQGVEFTKSFVLKSSLIVARLFAICPAQRLIGVRFIERIPSVTAFFCVCLCVYKLMDVVQTLEIFFGCATPRSIFKNVCELFLEVRLCVGKRYASRRSLL